MSTVQTVSGHRKEFNVMFNVGRVKYLLNYHNGVNMHKDGSAFFDIQCFSNKKKLNQYTKGLLSQGYFSKYPVLV